MLAAEAETCSYTTAEQQSEPYKNFINSLDSEVTKQGYRESMKHFMRFLKKETYDSLLGIEPLKLEGLIRDFIIHMRQDRKLSPATVSDNQIKKFLILVTFNYQEYIRII